MALMSLVCRTNNKGPNTDPWEIPQLSLSIEDFYRLTITVWVRHTTSSIWEVTTTSNETSSITSWSTVSNAALKSNNPRRATCSLSRAMLRFEYTLRRALSVEWNFRYALWCSWKALFDSRCALSCVQTIRSRSLDINVKFYTGLKFFLSPISRPRFFKCVLTTKIFCDAWMWPTASDLLNRCDTYGANSDAQFLTSDVGTGSRKQ